MKVRILTPEWNSSFEAEAVFLPGSLGEFEILPGHAPIVSSLEAGTVRWKISGSGQDTVEVANGSGQDSVSAQRLLIKGGVVRTDRETIDICVEI